MDIFLAQTLQQNLHFFCTPGINLPNFMWSFSASVLLKILSKETPLRNLELAGLNTPQISHSHIKGSVLLYDQICAFLFL